MENNNNQSIIIPLEFKVACCIYKVSVEEVLQIVIDHLTLYDLMNPTYHQGFTDSCRALILCIRQRGKRISHLAKGVCNCREIFFWNIHQIEVLALKKKKGWKTTMKRGYTSCFVDNIFSAMDRIFAPVNTLYLDEHTTLQLSKNFCVLCEMYECSPKYFLEYFMDQISIADAHACAGTKDKPNFFYSYFLKITSGFGRDMNKTVHLSDREIEFYDRMIDIRLETYIIRDRKKRADILRNCFSKHYQTMNPN